MIRPLRYELEAFGVSTHIGFLPESPPLLKLDPSYKFWEDLVEDVPALLKNKTFRAKANKLPVITTTRLSSEREWQRAYVLLSFLTHAYIWGGHRAAEGNIRNILRGYSLMFIRPCQERYQPLSWQSLNT